MTWSPEPTIEDLLGSLIQRGFRFVHPRDDQGEVLAVVGVRAHGNVLDVVRLDAEDDVTARRLPGDEQDILEPAKVLWSSTGTTHSVVADLLDLPDDHAVPSRQAPAKGWWARDGRRRARFVFATA